MYRYVHQLHLACSLAVHATRPSAYGRCQCAASKNVLWCSGESKPCSSIRGNDETMLPSPFVCPNAGRADNAQLWRRNRVMKRAVAAGPASRAASATAVGSKPENGATGRPRRQPRAAAQAAAQHRLCGGLRHPTLPCAAAAAATYVPAAAAGLCPLLLVQQHRRHAGAGGQPLLDGLVQAAGRHCHGPDKALHRRRPPARAAALQRARRVARPGRNLVGSAK